MGPFLFEFMDQRWLPASLHATLREVLGFHLRVTLGYYYTWAAREALKKMEGTGVRRVTELGAGSAGFSEALAALIQDHRRNGEVLISDLHPNVPRYRELEASFPGIIRARTEPTDFEHPAALGRDRIVVMSAAFHHIPLEERERILRLLAHRRVLVFESVTRTLGSMAGCAIGFVPALATPLYFFKQPSGRWRRFFWCWLIPAAPLMVAWDGVVSCLRCWTDDEWRRQLQKLGVTRRVAIERRRFSHMISW